MTLSSDPPPSPEPGPFLRRVKIRNYKSIERADVSLGRLTVLVGRNGSGKSNFLDALHFVSDALLVSLESAVKTRGGIHALQWRGHMDRPIGIDLEVGLPYDQIGLYNLKIAGVRGGGFEVIQESSWTGVEGDSSGDYEVQYGQLIGASVENMPPASRDRLYLGNASGFPVFRPLYDALLSMGFYNLSPEAMKELQVPDAGELLHRDGSNIASVFNRLNPGERKRIREYLATIVPEILSVVSVDLGPRVTLGFLQAEEGRDSAPVFYASSMSDGTLRALGTLVAVTQLAGRRHPVSLVGIEEPETALHPAAAGALMDALREASSHTQILLTTHSPDLLDQVDLETDTLLAVASREGRTEIAPIDGASREAIRSHLFSPGELLRLDQLEPDRKQLEPEEAG